MTAAIRRGDLGQRGTRQARALSILHGLEASLDFEKGGDIADGLAAIYREGRRLVIAGGSANDAEQAGQERAMLNAIAPAGAARGGHGTGLVKPGRWEASEKHGEPE